MNLVIEPKRGEIWWAHLGGNQGSEQGYLRPVVIVQNDTGNLYSPTVIVAAVSHSKRRDLPIHVPLGKGYSLHKKSVVLLEQIRTIDKSRLRTCLTRLTDQDMLAVDQALKVSLGLVVEVS